MGIWDFIKQAFSVPKVKDNGDIQPICPHCGKGLDKKPMRKTKCPFCRNDIYVRTKQKIFPSALLRKEDAIAADWLKNLGIKDRDFFKEREMLSKKCGEIAKSTDVIWSLFNRRLLPKASLEDSSSLYYSMALFLNQLGKDFFSLLQQSRKMELMRYKRYRWCKKVKIASNEEGCETCRRLKGRTLTIKEALKKMPIPCKECTNTLYDKSKGFCWCYYEAITP